MKNRPLPHATPPKGGVWPAALPQFINMDQTPAMHVLHAKHGAGVATTEVMCHG